jgi:hypothetical protein
MSNQKWGVEPGSVLMTPRRAGKTTAMLQDYERLKDALTLDQLKAIEKEVMKGSFLTGVSTASTAPPAATATYEELQNMVAAAQPTAAPPWAPPPPAKGGGGLLRQPTVLGSTPAPRKPNVLDSLVASATEFTRFQEKDQMTDAEKEAAKAVAAAINGLLTPSGAGPFTLTGPAQLTIKTRQGQYKKKAFIGDEEMRLTTSYAGSRDGVICVFKNTVPVEYAAIEIPLMEARELLSGFSKYVDSLNIADMDNIVAGIEQNIAQAVAVEREEAMAVSPEFGSW